MADAAEASGEDLGDALLNALGATSDDSDDDGVSSRAVLGIMQAFRCIQPAPSCKTARVESQVCSAPGELPFRSLDGRCDRKPTPAPAIVVSIDRRMPKGEGRASPASAKLDALPAEVRAMPDPTARHTVRTRWRSQRVHRHPHL